MEWTVRKTWHLLFQNAGMIPCLSGQSSSSGTAVTFNIFASQNWTVKTSQASKLDEHPDHHHLRSAHLANLPFVIWELQREGQILPLRGLYPSALVMGPSSQFLQFPASLYYFSNFTAHKTSLSSSGFLSHILLIQRQNNLFPVCWVTSLTFLSFVCHLRHSPLCT